ncbi:MAG: DASH family cryptochrome [Leadbetterella sp.]
MKRIIYWFRNDLRIEDNAALTAALISGNVLLVYIVDNREFHESMLGFKKTGSLRMKFLLESLHDLSTSIQKLGGNLHIRVGIPEIELFDIAQKYEIEKIVCSKACTQEETGIETDLSILLKTKNIEFELIWQNTLVHVRDLPFSIHKLPFVFTEFRKTIEQSWKIRKIDALPDQLNFLQTNTNSEIPTLESLGYSIPDIHQNSLDFLGGESEAKKHLNSYFFEKKLASTYKETRDGLAGLDYSTKFSYFLSQGCISAKTIYWSLKKFEEQSGNNESTYWIIFELLWRDYFYFVALKFGIRLFKRSGLKMDINKKWKKDKPTFYDWINGNTPDPFVNAFMKELKATGYMSNRGRQITASYLCHNLQIEWWWGAMYFESQLIDYDVCSNWGNWNYVAGIGNDPRPNRVFNTQLQAEKYDPQGMFVKMWS